jgi:hypothetical protein
VTALPVEWVLVIFYNLAAHKATYGRRPGSAGYTKDYIQLSQKSDFLDSLKRTFAAGSANVPLTFKWPMGAAPGELVFRSADRPHLKWETHLSAPAAWRMGLTPTDSTAETIPGDPGHFDPAKATAEFDLLASRGAGQPYLMAIKLRGEKNTLHLRVYLADAETEFDWANVNLLPSEIQALVEKTSRRSGLAWAEFIGSAEPPILFDPTKNHDAWAEAQPDPEVVPEVGDAEAEKLQFSIEELEAFREQITNESYEVTDTFATVKTRGSAQRAFAEVVKSNYGFRCAITGIDTPDFLVAAHIVPWSQDPAIRLDPSNGLCLSSLMDRAFEKGYIYIDDDLSVSVNWSKVGDDMALGDLLKAHDGQKIATVASGAPKKEYLKRRRALSSPS